VLGPDLDFFIKSYDKATINGLRALTLASMDALQNYFFWTWKIGKSTHLNATSSPLWHYRLGIDRGWIPRGLWLDGWPFKSIISHLNIDPRESIGYCSSLLNESFVFDGNYPSTATGAVGLFEEVPPLSTNFIFREKEKLRRQNAQNTRSLLR
jgi:hypothetical protein